METNNIKIEVKKRYAEIARQRGCDCGPSCCEESKPNASLVEYTNIDENIQAANLGLGCGKPTEHAKIKPGDVVLDLGSGAGIDVFIASKIAGPSGRVIGIDMTNEMIDRAKANAVEGNFTNVEFHLGDIETLPVDDRSVDIIISNCVINLTPDKRRVFKEMYRALKNGGHFTISDIVTHGNVPEKIRKDVELWAGCIAGALDQQEYLKIMEEVGFKNIIILDIKNFLFDKKANYGFSSITIEGYK